MKHRMFTGIVRHIGIVSAVAAGSGGKRLTIDVGPLAEGLKFGDSVAVSGVCLTITSTSGDALEFDVIKETLDTSTLGAKRTSDRVNLERALRAGDRLDGHFVQGHVDGTATVAHVRSSPKEWVIEFTVQDALRPYIIPKGSIAIDGVSLTVASVRESSFTVALIPTTLEGTTLSSLKVGATVNIESDMIARTIVHHLAGIRSAGGITTESLREAGYL